MISASPWSNMSSTKQYWEYNYWQRWASASSICSPKCPILGLIWKQLETLQRSSSSLSISFVYDHIQLHAGTHRNSSCMNRISKFMEKTKCVRHGKKLTKRCARNGEDIGSQRSYKGLLSTGCSACLKSQEFREGIHVDIHSILFGRMLLLYRAEKGA